MEQAIGYVVICEFNPIPDLPDACTLLQYAKVFDLEYILERGGEHVVILASKLGVNSAEFSVEQIVWREVVFGIITYDIWGKFRSSHPELGIDPHGLAVTREFEVVRQSYDSLVERYTSLRKIAYIKRVVRDHTEDNVDPVKLNYKLRFFEEVIGQGITDQIYREVYHLAG
ncbi:MAG: hypothetical protein PHS44_04740 [Candidatus Dojkabacteria bacterium]|nr:hypothetical protein [Candidatus Dojkabacteria bacterium]